PPWGRATLTPLTTQKTPEIGGFRMCTAFARQSATHLAPHRKSRLHFRKEASMSEVVKRLRERRANVWEQAKGLADRAAEENRQFSGEEEGQWTALNAELDA